MMPTVQISLPPETVRLLATARQWPPNLMRNLRGTLDYENELTVGHIVQHRATGKGPFPPAEGRLGVITSRYRRSVRRTRATVADAEIVSSIGSNVRYAGAHEFGFQGTVQVKQHRAKNQWKDIIEVAGRTLERWESFSAQGKKTKVASGLVTVRAHVREMNMPERAPIRRGITDRLPNYRDALSASIVQTFQG
jgi:phage gpG-like protein